jgi:hypothetical protein
LGCILFSRKETIKVLIKTVGQGTLPEKCCGAKAVKQYRANGMIKHRPNHPVSLFLLEAIMSYLTPSQILDVLKGDGDLEFIIRNGSPEYKEFVRDWSHDLRTVHQDAIIEAGCIYNKAVLDNLKSRQDYTQFFYLPENIPYISILMAMLDQNGIEAKKSAWELCRTMAENGAPYSGD